MSEPREITESFRLERVLRSSRSAIVFQAVDPGSGSPVAIKLIPPGSKADPKECQARFLAAMEAVAEHRPPCFPRLLDFGFTPDGSAFMVMEFVAGTRLDALTGPPPLNVLRLLADATHDLAVLAGNGVSHGNLAPENLLVTRHGEDEKVWILGFGTSAFQIGALADAGLALEGPPQFAAPERLEPLTASVRPDARSDVYSLALTACALLNAEVAPADAPAPSVLLPGPVTHRTQDPVLLRATLEKAVRRDAAERSASLEEFRKAILLGAFGSLDAPPPRHAAAAEAAPQPARPSGLALDEPFGSAPPAPPAPPRVPAPPATLAPPPTPKPGGGEGTLTMPTFPPAPQPPPPSAPSAHPPTTAAEPRRDRVQTGPVPIHRLPELPSTPPVPPPPPEPSPFGPDVAPPPADAVGSASVPAAEPAAPTRSQPAATRARSGSRLLLWLGLAAAVVIVTGGLVAFVMNRQSQRPQRVVTVPRPAQVRPTEPPKPTEQPRALTALQTSEAALALGDLVAAGQALKSITPTELDTFSVAERERYDTLNATYNTQVERALAKDLAKYLSNGNLKALGETVNGISKEDEAVYARNADITTALEEARRALNIQALLAKAQKQGQWAEVLQQSTVLASLVPRYAPASELRDKAAGVLEREATDLAAKGNYDLALGRLETIRRSWPNRQGLGARFERIRADQAADQKLAVVMAAVEQAEKEQAPEKGLELLAANAPNPRYEVRYQQSRERLAAQLTKLDPAPPTIVLTPGVKLEYKKGEAGTINVRITDDHAVKNARLFARVEGSVQFVELPLRRASGSDFAAEVSFNFHQNKTVEFYVVASDYSDHTAQLGSPKEPLKLKRKKWSLFGG